MDSHKIAVKFFADVTGTQNDLHFVPIFHSWIQTQAVPEHLLIDVADYAHVHHGPGAVLIAHEANFSTDNTDGRLGLMYARKQPVPGSLVDRMRQALVAALEGCKRLEDDPNLAGKIKFRTNEAMIRINDRLHAPHTTETFEIVRRQLQPFLSDVYGGDVTFHPALDSQRPLELYIHASTSPAIADLLSRLATAAATAPSR